ncbi:MAG: acetyl ornithine aminotransferase family protein [Deltaproteobacteria bacterium]|jgi:4-aminobutyrate aminotransferase|nr:acetyl ornithine aminotransferase family protein [Deltaproteobacteria bacterium]
MKKYPYPHIRTELPGPRATKIIKTDEQFVSPSYTRGYPCVADQGKGMILIDIDNNEFLDFCAGIAVCSTGHCHPEIVATIKKQAGKLIHMSGTDFYYEVQANLAKKLNRLAPGSHGNRVFFTNSGAESIEAAIKLARYKTGRTRLIAYIGAFHGRTIGALSLTGSKVIQKEGFAPLLQGVTHIPYPHCYRCQFGKIYGRCKLECFQYLENILFQRTVPPTEVAAVFIEPIQGEGGYVVPPREYLIKLQKLAEKHEFLVVADEVQSGMGRTGKMFASEHFGFVPDIICTAKGIASGMPLGAIIAKKEIMDWPPGSHASTFGGNPIACAAALKTIELLENGLMDNAVAMGEHLLKKLNRLKRKYPVVGDVRGLGLMVGMEMVKDRKTKTPDPALRDRIVERAFYKGLIILGCGSNSIRFAPALIVDKDHIDCCIQILEEIIAEECSS